MKCQTGEQILKIRTKIGVRGFPARVISSLRALGWGAWAAQKIWCRRRVARPPVHFQKMGAFCVVLLDNVFVTKRT